MSGGVAHLRIMISIGSLVDLVMVVLGMLVGVVVNCGVVVGMDVIEGVMAHVSTSGCESRWRDFHPQ